MEEKLFLRKIIDKAIRALNINYQTNTEFLDLYEQSLFLSNIKEFPSNINYKLFGGNEACERKIILFLPNEIKQEEIYYPIKVLQIIPNNFSQKLTHRDYLGAIINLGIERYTIGDIFCSEQEAYVFCLDNIANLIISELIKVKNTNVSINETELSKIMKIEHNYELIKGTVSSLRLDNILKLGFSLSRTNAALLIKEKKAFINNKLSEKCSCTVDEGNIISLRGHGKLKLNSIGDCTKKGRIFIELYKYK